MFITSVKEFGQTLRYFRHKQNLSQEKLSEISGLHRTYVGAIERGEKNVSIKKVLVLANALKVSPGDLFVKHSISE